MKMVYAGRVFLTVVAVIGSTTALPNHLKAVALDAVPVVQGTSVSASFGGYSAKAGLGGSAQGPVGGLYAAAESPFGSAGAGLGGTVAGGQKAPGSYAAVGGDQGSASSHSEGGHASVPAGPHTGGHKPLPQHQGPTAFDSIFNIPISVLQAVNTYLNNRGPVTKPVRPHHRRGHRPRPGHDDEDVVYKIVTPVRGEGPVAETPDGGAVEDTLPPGPSAVPASAPGVQGHAVVHKRVNYDDIFNIPISALKSVNDLLNGKK